MFDKNRSIIISEAKKDIREMCLSILSQIENNALKISFFCKAVNDKEYKENISVLSATVNERFGDECPLVSYIAQESSTGRLVAEVVYITDKRANIERRGNHVIITDGNCKELITAGITPKDTSRSTFEQAVEIFAVIGSILKENGFEPCDIYRQWNYIPGITTFNDGRQNYQEFNDARSQFYNSCKWTNGYPAATGIGTDVGGVMIELNAVKGKDFPNMAIDNPVQVAAHNYSQDVLKGRTVAGFNRMTTPKFERARIFGNTIFISGTAAIKGEKSNASTDVTEQTAMTMSIIDKLLSKDNIPIQNDGAEYNILRIYVKNKTDIPAVEEFMRQHYPVVPKHYLVCDICRPELLIEIEGTAHI